MTERTVRELAGEIWAELIAEMQDERKSVSELDSLSTQALNLIIDVTMGVLARYDGVIIVNDKDLPVEPLPQRT